MQIRCKTRELRESLAVAASATASAKGVGPIREVLARPRLGRLELHGTDREVAIRVVLDAEITGDSGDQLLPTKKLAAILAETVADDILITIDEKNVEVKTGGSRFRLSTESADGFPPTSNGVPDRGVKISSVLLRKIVNRTIFATDTASTRYALGGVLFELSGETLTCAATDSRRLAVCTTIIEVVGGKADIRGVVPVKVLRLLEKFPDCDVHVSMDDKSVYFVSDKYEVTGRLVEGRFPRYRDVIPKATGTSLVSMNVAAATAAIRQSLIVTTEESRAAIFHVYGGQMQIKSQAADVGDSEIIFDVDSGDADVSVHLDPNYIAHFLKCVPPESIIQWRILDENTAIVITDGDSYQYIVMPLSPDV